MNQKPKKQPWPWPFNHFQEEWPELKKAPWSFFFCCLASVVVSAIGATWVYNTFVIPIKEATIQRLQTDRDFFEKRVDKLSMADEENAKLKFELARMDQKNEKLMTVKEMGYKLIWDMTSYVETNKDLAMATQIGLLQPLTTSPSAPTDNKPVELSSNSGSTVEYVIIPYDQIFWNWCFDSRIRDVEHVLDINGIHLITLEDLRTHDPLFFRTEIINHSKIDADEAWVIVQSNLIVFSNDVRKLENALDSIPDSAFVH